MPRIEQDDKTNFVRSEKYGENVSEFVIFDRGRVVGSATVRQRRIPMNGRWHSIAELDNVFTDMHYRRQGLARQNITAATAYIGDGGFDLGILSCDANKVGFYYKFGWRVVEDPRTLVEAGLGRVSSSRRMMVRGTAQTTTP